MSTVKLDLEQNKCYFVYKDNGKGDWDPIGVRNNKFDACKLARDAYELINMDVNNDNIFVLELGYFKLFDEFKHYAVRIRPRVDCFNSLKKKFEFILKPIIEDTYSCEFEYEQIIDNIKSELKYAKEYLNKDLISEYHYNELIELVNKHIK